MPHSYRRPLAIVAALVVLAGGLYLMMNLRSEDGERNDSALLTLESLGYGQPALHQLADTFRDENGDMVADWETDQSKFQDVRAFRFSYLARAGETESQQQWADFSRLLAQQVKRAYQMVPHENIDDQLNDFKDGKLQLIAVETGAVSRAVSEAGFVPLAMLGNEQGAAGHKLQFIVHPESKLRAIESIQGQTVTFTHPASLAGCKAAVVTLLKEYDLRPKRDYLWDFSYGQLESTQGVSQGDIAVAAVASDHLQHAIAVREIQPGSVRVLYESETDYPPTVFGVPHNIDQQLAETVREFLLSFSITDSSLKPLFEGTNVTRFIPVDYKADWAGVREIEKQLAAAPIDDAS